MSRKNNNLMRRTAEWLTAPLRSVVRAMTPMYDAAGQGRRVRGWSPEVGAINALVQAAGDELRAKSRDMARRNAWASNAIETFVSNAIGSGITPQSQHTDSKVREKIHEAWKTWTDEADANGTTDFYGLQSLACKEALEGGEVFARLRPRRSRDEMTVPLQIQLLEAEHVPLWKTEEFGSGFYCRQGIEFNGIGKRTAYWMYPQHPNDINQRFDNSLRRVPAEEVLHLYRPLRAEQQRGEPWLTKVLIHLYELEKYDSAELIRKQLAAMMAFFIEDSDPANPLFKGETEDDDGIPVEGIEPGCAITLPSGKSIKFNSPSDVGGMYLEFMRLQLRKIAAGVGVTYEALSGDLENVNYSSIRAGMLEFRRRCEAFQHQVMVFQFCRPVWKAWLGQAALAGVINALDYQRRPQEYLRVEWRPQAWPWVDPLKDIEAELLAVDNLFKSRSAVIKGMGYDPEQVDQEISDDQDREKEKGLERRSKAQQPQQQPEQPKRKNNAA